ncbi:MAG: hypothetical protein HFJ79_10935 [Clostridiales bacterium]|jgi:hypothetical protein|nr:hypothetical protein [Clostridiales bacterium]
MKNLKKLLAVLMAAAMMTATTSVLTGLAAGAVTPEPTNAPVALVDGNTQFVEDATHLFPQSVAYDAATKTISVTNKADATGRFQFDIGKYIDVEAMPNIHLKITADKPFTGAFFGYNTDPDSASGMLHFTLNYPEATWRTSTADSNIVTDTTIGTAVDAGTYDVYLNAQNLVQSWPVVVRDGALYLDRFLFVMEAGGTATIQMSVPQPTVSIGFDMRPMDGFSTTPETNGAVIEPTYNDDGSVTLNIIKGASWPSIVTQAEAPFNTVDLNSFPFLYYEFSNVAPAAGTTDIGVNAVIHYKLADGTVKQAQLSAFTERGDEDFRQDAYGYIDFRTYLANRGRLPADGVIEIVDYSISLYGNTGATATINQFMIGAAPVDII